MNLNSSLLNTQWKIHKALPESHLSSLRGNHVLKPVMKALNYGSSV
jgi:hypothetical protein